MKPLPTALIALLLGPFIASCAAAPAASDPNLLPKGHDYFELRSGLANSRRTFERTHAGRVVFLGGSITAGGAWRQHICDYLTKKFHGTTFEFINAGIGSLGSVPHAFRLERDVLAHGPVDLLFLEAAVNDTSNTADPAHMLRGLEGVVRHVRIASPLTDIVQLHFVMPEHMADYNGGKVPASITQHERVAVAYGNPSLNLSREVTDRINAGEFSWDQDFKNLHPSPFGHQLYANSAARLLNAAFAAPLAAAEKLHPLPPPVDPTSYFRGRFGEIREARNIQGFTIEKTWRPADQKGTRRGFFDVPALVGTEPGAEFEFSFEGTGCGLFITAGPDAGRLEFSVDGGAYRSIETYTRWSNSLHLPWAVILDDNLKLGRHVAKVRIARDHDAKATGTALRVFHLLLN